MKKVTIYTDGEAPLTRRSGYVLSLAAEAATAKDDRQAPPDRPRRREGGMAQRRKAE